MATLEELEIQVNEHEMRIQNLEAEVVRLIRRDKIFKLLMDDPFRYQVKEVVVFKINGQRALGRIRKTRADLREGDLWKTYKIAEFFGDIYSEIEEAEIIRKIRKDRVKAAVRQWQEIKKRRG